MNRLAAIALIVAAGCYEPSFRQDIECGDGDSCPDGLVCAADRICRTTILAPDASVVAECTDATEGAPCGSGTTCGDFTLCQFTDDCDQDGEQTRPCTDQVCRGGECVSQDREETATCARDTEGVACGGETVIDCDSCGGFTDVCDESGARPCTCLVPVCAAGTCSGTSSTTCARPCTRDTDGDTCGPTMTRNCGSCSGCEKECVCETPVCDAGACTDINVDLCTIVCSPCAS